MELGFDGVRDAIDKLGDPDKVSKGIITPYILQ
jgi:hypothetical protein